MTLRYPDIFKEFTCIGSDCKDNCCKMGWDIEIDSGTLEYYRGLDTDLGRRLCESIYEEDGCYYMSQQEGCPFLSAEGLCTVQQTCGAEHISEICREHPRFYEWFGDYKEAGLGLCCEEVSRLVMTHERPILFTEKQIDEETDDMEFDSECLAAVKMLRDRLIDIAQDRGFSLLQRLVILCYAVADIHDAMQDGDCERLKKLSGMLAIDGFRMEIVIQAQKDMQGQSKLRKESLSWLFSGLAGMEYMGGLKEKFVIDEDTADAMLKAESGFSGAYSPYEYELENVLVYFLYRYFIKCTRYDDMAEDYLFSAVYMTLALRGLFLREYAENGVLPDKERRIYLVKEFSKEVEYDSDNMDIIYDDISCCGDTRDKLCRLCL